MNAFSLWKPDLVQITHGAEHVATYQKTDGLPKLKDFPAELGGSGATMAE